MQTVADCENHIVEGIASGRYKRSQRLGEVSVARELGCGQALVRAAFEKLTHAGVLDRKHRSGTYVRELSTAEFVEMTQVRALLEGLACRMACRYASAADLEQLDKIAKKLDSQLAQLTPDRFREIEAADVEFHCRIAQLSRNSVVIRILDNQQLILRLLRTGFDLPSAFTGHARHIPSHAEIVEAIRKRDPKEADRCMRRHLIECLRSELCLDSVVDF